LHVSSIEARLSGISRLLVISKKRQPEIMRTPKRITLYGLLLLCLLAGRAGGHPMVERCEPGEGATITGSPAHVRIWFDGVLGPSSSTLRVLDAKGRQVDNQDGHVD